MILRGSMPVRLSRFGLTALCALGALSLPVLSQDRDAGAGLPAAGEKASHPPATPAAGAPQIARPDDLNVRLGALEKQLAVLMDQMEVLRRQLDRGDTRPVTSAAPARRTSSRKFPDAGGVDSTVKPDPNAPVNVRGGIVTSADGEGSLGVSLGTDQGVQAGDDLLIQRGGETVGRVKVVEPGKDLSQVKILEGDSIRLGDRVVLQTQPTTTTTSPAGARRTRGRVSALAGPGDQYRASSKEDRVMALIDLPAKKAEALADFLKRLEVSGVQEVSVVDNGDQLLFSGTAEAYQAVLRLVDAFQGSSGKDRYGNGGKSPAKR